MGVITVTGSRTITEASESPTPITSVDIASIARHHAERHGRRAEQAAQHHGRTHAAHPGQRQHQQRRQHAVAAQLRPLAHAGAAGRPPRRAEQPGRLGQHRRPAADAGEAVDIVTGGASAIYGSDAVAGVVNYVLDKEFTGLSVKADFGMSKYSDGEEYQFGAAWGTSLFSDRGHFEVAARIAPSGHDPDAASVPMAKMARPGC